MRFTTVAAILAFACAAVAAPQGHDGGDGHNGDGHNGDGHNGDSHKGDGQQSHGEEEPDRVGYCCAYGSTPSGASVTSVNPIGEPLGCTLKPAECTGDRFYIPWECVKESHSDKTRCECLGAECPNGPSGGPLVELLDVLPIPSK
ncbi:hypothetical protein BDV27DRAFT_152222 [Aspergillus caelatus]|uniref:Uncharacterized protein n=1 Tax=Aspergillus caelatus TaxID=61420 RepID=A0A5N7AKF1_9EURO|nr:uncharacterized protein BDV27DRAFT_152222 [Aspergillus caelatus]KAE8370337.1 hypothetical protein BDV27DRAFT_152222 [Aspergillus caelatus]